MRTIRRFINNIYAILNPHQGATFDSEKGITRKLIPKNSLVFLQGASIEPTTKKNLEAFCKYSTKQDQEENSKKAKN